MYAIYGNIYHQYTPNVSIYIAYMDPLGEVKIKDCHQVPGKTSFGFGSL